MGLTEILPVVACCVIPALMIASCTFEFENGAIVRSETAWLNRWQVTLAVAAVLSVGAFLLEVSVYQAGSALALRWAIAMSLATLAAFSDMKERIISNRQVALAMLFGAIAVLLQALEDFDGWNYYVVDAAAGCVVGALIFLISRVISKGGVGFGDVKLYAALGLLLGIRGVLSVALYSIVIAFVVSIVLLATKRKKLSDRLPLAPFTFFGVALAIAFGV